jgi:hypothetical protein
VWTDVRYGIKARFVDAEGAPLGDEILVAANTPFPETAGRFAYLHHGQPAVTPLRDGGYLAVWAAESGELSYSYFRLAKRVETRQLRALVLDADGLAVGIEMAVGPATGVLQSRPSVAPLADGGAVVSWEEQERDASPSNILARLFSPAGSPYGERVEVSADPAASTARPMAAAAGEAGFLVAWTGDDGSGTGILSRRFDATGSALGPVRVVNASRAANQTTPYVTATASGGFVVAFQSTRMPEREVQVFTRALTANGVAVGAQHQVSDPEIGTAASAPALARLADGSLMAFWLGWKGNLPFWVMARPLNGQGEPVGDAVEVSAERPRVQRRLAAVGGGDGLFVAWEGFDGGSKAVTGRAYHQPAEAVGLKLSLGGN